MARALGLGWAVCPECLYVALHGSLRVVNPLSWQLRAPGRLKRPQEAQVEAAKFLRI